MNNKKNLFARILDGIALLIFVGVNLFLALGWGRFPQEVAGHYNLAGEIDRMAGKSSLLIYLLIAWIVFILLSVAERFPKFLGGKKIMNEENESRILGQVEAMLAMVKLLALGILTYAIMRSALVLPLGPWFLPGVLILTFICMIFFIIRIFMSAE